MDMTFIGAGKVGTALAIYLKNKGFNIKGFYSRTFSSAQKAAEIAGTQAFKDLQQVADSDMIWITTNDDAIEDVAKQLAALEHITNRHIIAHMSGAHGSSTLSPLKEKGCSVYSLHPLQAFADIKSASQALKDTVFTIEGSQDKMDTIKEIFQTIDNNYFLIEERGKILYHAGACILSNYLITLMDSAFNLFEQAGIERNKILDATMPLILGTLNNIQNKGTKAALTGPIQRSDIRTIQNHIEALKIELPEELEFYQLMGLKTVEMVKENKETKQRIELINVLKGGQQNE